MSDKEKNANKIMILPDIVSGTDKEIFWLLIYLSVDLILPTGALLTL